MQYLHKIKEDFYLAYQPHGRDYLLERKVIKLLSRYEKVAIAAIIIGVALIAYKNLHV